MTTVEKTEQEIGIYTSKELSIQNARSLLDNVTNKKFSAHPGECKLASVNDFSANMDGKFRGLIFEAVDRRGNRNAVGFQKFRLNQKHRDLFRQYVNESTLGRVENEQREETTIGGWERDEGWNGKEAFSCWDERDVDGHSNESDVNGQWNEDRDDICGLNELIMNHGSFSV